MLVKASVNTVPRILALAVALAWLAGAVRWSAGAPPDFSEAERKAILLLNLVRFTDWPENIFTNSTESLTVTIVGTNSFSGILQKLLETETKDGRKIAVHTVEPGEELPRTHLLFITASVKDHINEILNRARQEKFLSVAEIDRFAEEYGMVTLLLDNPEPLTINLSRVKKGGYKISPRILKHARRINTE